MRGSAWASQSWGASICSINAHNTFIIYAPTRLHAVHHIMKSYLYGELPLKYIITTHDELINDAGRWFFLFISAIYIRVFTYLPCKSACVFEVFFLIHSNVISQCVYIYIYVKCANAYPDKLYEKRCIHCVTLRLIRARTPLLFKI